MLSFPSVRRNDWDRVTKASLAGFAAGMALFIMLVTLSEPGFVFILDHANLLFHEAGHPFVGMVSERLEPYGGTLGQLTFPAVLAASFWRRRQPMGVAGAGVWFFENWLNIARYMADARKLQLPLVGGGDHDWNTIFTRWDILQYDTHIAAGVRLVAWVAITGACGWLLWRAWQDAQHPEPQPEFLSIP